jgi:hypothetical protein
LIEWEHELEEKSMLNVLSMQPKNKKIDCEQKLLDPGLVLRRYGNGESREGSFGC